MKSDPIRRFDQRVELTQRARDVLKSYSMRTEKAVHDRSSWRDKRAHFQRRRYGQEFRNPTFPWPGSSSIVLPLIDKKIDELKPQYLNMITAVNPPVTALALDPESQRNAPSVELWFDWLLKFGSPGFMRELMLGVDDTLESGRGVYKSMWRYRTLPSPETLEKRRLPPRLATIAVGARNADEANMMQAMAQQMGLQEQILTPREFDQNRDAIAHVVALEFDLDPDESRDGQALKKIMEWLRDGGREPLTIMKRDVREDAPAIQAIDQDDFIVPANTTDLEDAVQLTHRIWFSGETQLMQAARDRKWNMKAVKEVLDRLGRKKGRGPEQQRGGAFANEDYARDQKDRQGITDTDVMSIEIHETCGWYSSERFGAESKVVALVHPDHPDVPFKFYKYHRPSMKWPFHSPVFEMSKAGYYDPRGVPEILGDLEEEITFQHRAKLNRMMIANAPSFLYRQTSGINPSQFTWAPAQFYPVKDVNSDMKALEVPNVQFSEEREEQILRTWAEDRLGGADFGISNDLSSLTEPRTATEIRGIEQRGRAALSMRGALFQDAMQGVYREFFDMWHQYGPQEVWVRMTGTEPLKVTREELQGQFLFQPTGTIGESDPVLDAQKSLGRLQVLMQLQQAGAMEPQFELNMGEAVADWLEKDDIRLSRRVLRRRSEEEVQQIVQQQQAQEAAVNKALANEEMDPEEMGIALNQMSKKAPHGKAQKVNFNGGR
jgi:hypothetical protein